MSLSPFLCSLSLSPSIKKKTLNNHRQSSLSVHLFTSLTIQRYMQIYNINGIYLGVYLVFFSCFIPHSQCRNSESSTGTHNIFASLLNPNSLASSCLVDCCVTVFLELKSQLNGH